jgi:hypothetical protein
MRKPVADTDYYVIAVDPAKNRIYLTLTGFWKNLTVVPHFLDDLQKALKDVSRGFTVLTDATKMKTPPPEVGALHEKGQKLLLEHGLKKTAEIVPPEKALEKMSLEKWSKKSGMLKAIFHEAIMAEAWLDEKE